MAKMFFYHLNVFMFYNLIFTFLCNGVNVGLPLWLSGKESARHAGDIRGMGSILGLGRPPGGGMATHSSVLAWRIPWTEEPGMLQSIGSQRVGHDCSD